MSAEWSNFLIYSGVRCCTRMGMESAWVGADIGGNWRVLNPRSQEEEWFEFVDSWSVCCVVRLLYFHTKKRKILLCKKSVELVVQCQFSCTLESMNKQGYCVQTEIEEVFPINLELFHLKFQGYEFSFKRPHPMAKKSFVVIIFISCSHDFLCNQSAVCSWI